MKNIYEQWQVRKGERFSVCGQTRETLPAGAYLCQRDCDGTPIFKRQNLQVDDLIDISDSLANRVLGEVDDFWGRGHLFEQFGFLHRRGYMFYGVQGCGKSSLIHQIVSKIIEAGHVAFFCIHPYSFLECVQEFRRVEKDRPIVCVFEDVDAIIERYGDSEILQWLDGNYQVNMAVNIASTNYPEKLDPRLVSRPRRFDRVLEIGLPSVDQRDAYFTRKLPHLPQVEREVWSQETEGLSFASLAELIISVCCLGNDFQETLQTLKEQHIADRFGKENGKSESHQLQTTGADCCDEY